MNENNTYKLWTPNLEYVKSRVERGKSLKRVEMFWTPNEFEFLVGLYLDGGGNFPGQGLEYQGMKHYYFRTEE